MHTLRMMWRTSLASAILLLGASIASAFPINNSTSTSTGTSLSGNLTVVRVDDGNFLKNGSGTDYNNLGAIAAVFSTQTTGSGPYTPRDNQTFIGRTFKTFCIELSGWLNSGAYDTTTIEKIPPATAGPNGVGYVEGGADSVLQRVAWVIQNGASLVAGSAAEKAAGTQLAIWEIIYDAGTQTVGSLTAFNRDSTGAVDNTTGTRGLKVDSGYSAQAQTNAATLLAASLGKSSSGFIFRQNIRYELDGSYTVLAGNGQTVMTGVPEPSTLAIAGLGALGFLGYAIRRRGKA